jgi:hypothetical protein
VVIFVVTEHTIARLPAGPPDRLILLATISLIVRAVTDAVTVAALVLLVRALSSRARSLGWAALLLALPLLVVDLVCFVAAAAADHALLTSAAWYWTEVPSGFLFTAGVFVALLAARAALEGPARRWRSPAGIASLLYATFEAAGIVLWAMNRLEPSGRYGFWIQAVLSWAAATAFVVAARGLARALGSPEQPEQPIPTGVDPAWLDGARSLRGVVKAAIARVIVMIGLQIAVMVSLVRGRYGDVGFCLVAAAIVNAILTALLVSQLVGYARFAKKMQESSAISLAVGLIAFGVALDLLASISAKEYFDMVGSAQNATSFWGMPSLSRIESLQQLVEWGGRAALLLSLGAAVAVAHSLGGLAQVLGAPALSRRAAQLCLLIPVTGIGGLLLMALLVKVRDGFVVFLLAIGILVVAIAIAVSWARLALELARALERGGAA